MIDLQRLQVQTLEKCREIGAAVAETRLSLPVPDLGGGKRWAWYFLYNVDPSGQLYRPFARLATALESGEISGIVPIAPGPDQPLAHAVHDDPSDEQWEAFNRLFPEILDAYDADLSTPLSCQPVAEFLDLLETLAPPALLPWYFAQHPSFFYWGQALRSLHQLGVSSFSRQSENSVKPDLTLAESELILLAALYRSPTLSGAENIYNPSSSAVQQIHSAAQNLIASSQLLQNNSSAHLTSELASIGKVYGAPQSTLLSVYVGREELRENRYIYDGETWLSDTFLTEDRHRLTVTDPAAIVNRLESDLVVVSPEIEERYWLLQPAIQEVRDIAAREGEAPALEWLSQAIGDREAAASLLSALYNPQYTLSVVHFAFEGRSLERLRGGNLSQGDLGAWLLAPYVDEAGQETERVIATPASDPEVRTWLESVVRKPEALPGT